MTATDVIQSLISAVKLDMELNFKLTKSTRGRQLWLVAIAGFALLNSPRFSEAVSARPLVGLDYVIISIPWLLAAVFAVNGHYQCDQVDIRRHRYYLNKLAELDLFLEATEEGEIDPSKWKALINDNTEAIKPLKIEADSSATNLNRIEIVALAGIILGMSWTVIFPVLTNV